MQTPVYEPLQPKVVLGVAAHPDDLDFGVSGTVAKYIAEGAKGYYLILTNGNKGTSDRSLTPEQLRDTRREEQRNAARILGVEEVFFCDYNDGELMPSLDVKRDIVRVIRQVKPDVVLTMDPTMVYATSWGAINHPDHRAAGQATLDAVYPFARDHLAFPELCNDEHLEPHNTAHVLMVNFEESNFYVDISDHLETKLAALRAHASQIPDVDGTMQFVRQRAELAGAKVGGRYAEGFIRLDIRG